MSKRLDAELADKLLEDMVAKGAPANVQGDQDAALREMVSGMMANEELFVRMYLHYCRLVRSEYLARIVKARARGSFPRVEILAYADGAMN